MPDLTDDDRARLEEIAEMRDVLGMPLLRYGDAAFLRRLGRASDGEDRPPTEAELFPGTAAKMAVLDAVLNPGGPIAAATNALREADLLADEPEAACAVAYAVVGAALHHPDAFPWAPAFAPSFLRKLVEQPSITQEGRLERFVQEVREEAGHLRVQAAKGNHHPDPTANGLANHVAGKAALRLIGALERLDGKQQITQEGGG